MPNVYNEEVRYTRGCWTQEEIDNPVVRVVKGPVGSERHQYLVISVIDDEYTHPIALKGTTGNTELAIKRILDKNDEAALVLERRSELTNDGWRHGQGRFYISLSEHEVKALKELLNQH